MGLMSWLAGRYAVKSAQRTVQDARSLPIQTRKQIVRHLVQQMKRSIDAEPQGASAVALATRDIVQDATHGRQMAVASGANNRRDPEWCGAALVECWATARFGAIVGRISKAKFDRVDAIMFDLITETLSPEELELNVGGSPRRSAT